MAYARGRRSYGRRAGGFARPARSSSRGGYRRSGGTARRSSTARRSTGRGQQTIVLRIEGVGASGVSRPSLNPVPGVPVTGPKKAKL